MRCCLSVGWHRFMWGFRELAEEDGLSWTLWSPCSLPHFILFLPLPTLTQISVKLICTVTIKLLETAPKAECFFFLIMSEIWLHSEGSGCLTLMWRKVPSCIALKAPTPSYTSCKCVNIDYFYSWSGFLGIEYILILGLIGFVYFLREYSCTLHTMPQCFETVWDYSLLCINNFELKRGGLVPQ